MLALGSGRTTKRGLWDTGNDGGKGRPKEGRQEHGGATKV